MNLNRTFFVCNKSLTIHFNVRICKWWCCWVLLLFRFVALHFFVQTPNSEAWIEYFQHFVCIQQSAYTNHTQHHMLTSVCCCSVALISLVLFWYIHTNASKDVKFQLYGMCDLLFSHLFYGKFFTEIPYIGHKFECITTEIKFSLIWQNCNDSSTALQYVF